MTQTVYGDAMKLQRLPEERHLRIDFFIILTGYAPWQNAHSVVRLPAHWHNDLSLKILCCLSWNAK